MLPYLTQLEFSDIMPLHLSGRSFQQLDLIPGINVYLAENGSGKTTLADLIERSICSDAHEQRYRDLAAKRRSKEAYIKGSWVFGEKETIIIRQDLTDAGMRTRILTSSDSRERSTSKQEYGMLINRQTGLSLPQFQEIYHGLYYKRENDNLLLGSTEDELQEFFTLLSKMASSMDPEILSIKQQLADLKAKRKEVQKARDRLLRTEEDITQFLKRLGVGTYDEDLLEEQKARITADIDAKKEEIALLTEELRKIDMEEQELRNQREVIEEERRQYYEQREDLRQDLRTIQLQLKQLQSRQQALLRTEPSSQEKLRQSLQKHPYCSVCGTNLLDEWEKRIQVGCPQCGTPWSHIPPKIKDSFLGSSLPASSQPSTQELLADIQQQIQNEDARFQQLKEEMQQLNDRLLEIETLMKDLRLKEQEKAAKRRRIREEIRQLNQEIEKRTRTLGEINAKIEFYRQQGDLTTVTQLRKERDEQLDQLTKQIKDLESRLPEHEELKEILTHFTRSFETLFGYQIILDPQNRVVSISSDNSTRSFESLSWGERYFVDIFLRVAIWEYILSRKLAIRGMLVLDSPEAALDEKRLSILAQFLNHYKEKITFIVTTRNKEFLNQLKGQRLKLKKSMQTSLFDFMKASAFSS